MDVSKLTDDINSDLESLFTEVEGELQEYLDKEIGEFDKDILMDDIFEGRLKGHPFINFFQIRHDNKQ